MAKEPPRKPGSSHDGLQSHAHKPFLFGTLRHCFWNLEQTLLAGSLSCSLVVLLRSPLPTRLIWMHAYHGATPPWSLPPHVRSCGVG